jgi:hypothetical protein
MQTITVKVTDLGHESLLRTAKERNVSIEEIAEERITEGDVYDGPPLAAEEEAAFDEEYHTKDRRALREWHESLARHSVAALRIQK